jgi:hypothetical protein
VYGRNQQLPWQHLMIDKPLAYPPVPNFLSALLVMMGDHTQASMVVPSTLLIVSMAAMLYCLTVRVIGAREDEQAVREWELARERSKAVEWVQNLLSALSGFVYWIILAIPPYCCCCITVFSN